MERIVMQMPALPLTSLYASLLILLLFCGEAWAQSGRAVMKGYVAFEDFAYVDKQPRARVELCASATTRNCASATETDEHGLFEISPAPLGERWLRISAAGFTTYQIRIFLPSDFIGNVAVMLKHRVKSTQRRMPGAQRHHHPFAGQRLRSSSKTKFSSALRTTLSPAAAT
jgi:hypothetical protein